MNSTKLNYWIIDLDGTLVDSRIDITNALNKTFTHFNLETVSEDLVRKYVGVGIRDIINQIVPENLIEEYLKEFDKTYLENITETTRLYPGWEEILANTPNIPKIILSNKYLRFCNAIVERLGISQYFSAVYGRESFKEHKPSPYPVLEILKKHGFNKEQTVIIGDTNSDFQSGKSAGITTCGVLYGYSDEQTIIKNAPDIIIKTVNELAKI